MLLNGRVNRSQPGGGGVIDWQNPLTRGLILCLNSAAGSINLARRGTLATVGGAYSRGVSAGGQYIGTSNTNYFTYTPPSTLTNATLFALERQPAAGGAQGPWKTNSTEFDFAPYSGNTFYFNTFANARYVAAAAAPAGINWNAFSVCCRGGAAANSHAAFVNGVKLGSTNSPFTCDATISIAYNGFSSADQGYLRLMWDRVLTDDEVRSISANPWQIFRAPDRRVWVAPPADTGTHDATGSLSAGAATVAGSATRLALHTASGALASGSATIAGAAAHQHATTGALVAGSATIAGAATHLTLHTSTGALAAGSATVAGSSAHTVPGGTHAAAGALAAGSATIAGSGVHLTLRGSTGALAGQSASIAGAAVRFALHSATGALAAGSATVSASASRSASTSPIAVLGPAFLQNLTATTVRPGIRITY